MTDVKANTGIRRFAALTVIIRFHPWKGFSHSYSISVAMRRMWPPAPMMCIGKNVALKNTNVRNQWILPSVSFIIRPNIFGYQKKMPPKTEKSEPPNTT